MVSVKSEIRPEVLRALLAEVTQLQRALRKVHSPVIVRLFLLPALPVFWGFDNYLRLLQETYEQLLGVRDNRGGLLRTAFTRYVAWGLFAKGWDVADDQMIRSIARFTRVFNRIGLVGIVVWETLFSLVIWYLLMTWLLGQIG